VPDMVRFLAEMPEYDISLYTHKKMKTSADTAPEALRFAQGVLTGIADWTESNIHEALMGAIAEAGLKNGAILWPLRIALSGLQSTPGGAV